MMWEQYEPLHVQNFLNPIEGVYGLYGDKCLEIVQILLWYYFC